MVETSFLIESLIDVLISLIGPVVIGISMFVLWLTLRRAVNTNPHTDPHAIGLLANGFGFLFLSIAAPFAIGLITLLLGDSADEISEFWFSMPAAILTVIGTIYIVLGTKKLVRPSTPVG